MVVRVYGPRLTLISHFMTLSFTPVRHLSSTRPHHPLHLHPQTLHSLNIFRLHSPVFTGIYSLSIFLYHFLGRQLHLNLLQLNFVTHKHNGFWCFLPLPQSFVENFSYEVGLILFSTTSSFRKIKKIFSILFNSLEGFAYETYINIAVTLFVRFYLNVYYTIKISFDKKNEL